MRYKNRESEKSIFRLSVVGNCLKNCLPACKTLETEEKKKLILFTFSFKSFIFQYFQYFSVRTRMALHHLVYFVFEDEFFLFQRRFFELLVFVRII